MDQSIVFDTYGIAQPLDFCPKIWKKMEKMIPKNYKNAQKIHKKTQSFLW